MKVIEIEDTHIVVISTKKSKSNYNKSVSVFRVNEKTPLFGTILGDHVSNEFIVSWAKHNINEKDRNDNKFADTLKGI